MRPKFGDARSATGTAKLAWFAVLKLSARNWRVHRSVKRKFFMSDVSRLANPGPRAILRPALPNWPASDLGSRRRNEDRLSHCPTVCGPALGSPATSGRLAKYADSGGLLACKATFAVS